LGLLESFIWEGGEGRRGVSLDVSEADLAFRSLAMADCAKAVS